MLREAWSDAPGWEPLDAAVRDEFGRGVIEHPPADPRYDSVLLVWLRWDLDRSTNAYLESELRAEGLFTSAVVGRVSQARLNFLVHGIFDPRRAELLEHREPAEKDRRARRFALSSGGDEVSEPGTSWTSRALESTTA
jgi:hypothetical protein